MIDWKARGDHHLNGLDASGNVTEIQHTLGHLCHAMAQLLPQELKLEQQQAEVSKNTAELKEKWTVAARKAAQELADAASK
jgi:hypothetical protein